MTSPEAAAVFQKNDGVWLPRHTPADRGMSGPNTEAPPGRSLPIWPKPNCPSPAGS